MQAIIYSRGSTDKQDNTHGAQITRCMEWITREGLLLKGVFSEAISGGADLIKRKVLTAAIDELSVGDILVVTKRDRFGRSLLEIRKAEEQIRARGARIYSLELGYNETINDRFQNGVRDLMNEDERARISERTKHVMEHLINEGRFTGRAPLGSTTEVREDGRKYIVEDEAERAVIDQVKEWRRAGHTHSQIIELCRAQEITSRDGRTPSQATISRWTRGVEVKRRSKPSPAVKAPGLFGRRARPRLEDQLVGLLHCIEQGLESGLSHAKITSEVERAGYRTSKGKPIRKSQITAIIARNKKTE